MINLIFVPITQQDRSQKYGKDNLRSYYPADYSLFQNVHTWLIEVRYVQENPIRREEISQVRLAVRKFE